MCVRKRGGGGGGGRSRTRRERERERELLSKASRCAGISFRITAAYHTLFCPKPHLSTLLFFFQPEAPSARLRRSRTEEGGGGRGVKSTRSNSRPEIDRRTLKSLPSHWVRSSTVNGAQICGRLTLSQTRNCESTLSLAAIDNCRSKTRTARPAFRLAA